MIAVVMRVALFQRAAEGALGRGDRAGAARVDLDRLPQGACQPLEARFDDMVIVLAVDILDVQREAGRLGKGLEPFLEQFSVHLAELWPREGNLPDQIGAVRGVEA